MSAQHPPRLAMFLLTRFAAGPHHDSIVGDLVEQLADGRSSAWFWRQTFMAIGAARWRDLRTHKMLAATALLSGLPLLYALMVAGARLTVIVRAQLSEWLYHHAYFSLEWFVASSRAPDLVFGCLAYAACGWVVARLHVRSLSAFLLFATIVMLGHARLLAWIIEMMVRRGDFPSGAWFALTLLTSRPLALVIGGLLAFDRAILRAEDTACDTLDGSASGS